MIEFAKGCDYAMHMVDEILDTITKGEHRKTVNFIQERKKVEEEEAALRRQQEEFSQQLESEWHQLGESSVQTLGTNVNFESLQSLNDLGIDTQFLNEFQVSENAGYATNVMKIFCANYLLTITQLKFVLFQSTCEARRDCGINRRLTEGPK